MNKKKVFIYPNFYFEAIVSAWLDASQYEIVAFDGLPRGEFAAEGEFCFPLQYLRGLIARAVTDLGAEIIIGARAEVCAYPFAVAELVNSGKSPARGCLIPMNQLALTPLAPWQYYRALRCVFPELSLGRFVGRLPLALGKLVAAEKIYRDYLRVLPLTARPDDWKRQWYAARRALLAADSRLAVRKVTARFWQASEEARCKESPRLRLALSGDFSVLLLEFLLLDLDVYLARRGIEIIQPFTAISSFSLRFFSAAARQARRWLNSARQSETPRRFSDKHYLIERITLAQMARALEQRPDGLIFLRPAMCTPCQNVARVLAQIPELVPVLSVTYDGHSGMAGLQTRLEAFINIIEENHVCGTSEKS